MRTTLALLRAAWLSALSYRTSFLVSLGGLLFTIVPLYFVSRALQSTMAPRIASEGSDYFGFVLVGTAILSLAAASLNALPGAVSGGLNNGYLEMLLTLPVSRLGLLAGISAYPMLYSAVRALLTFGLGALLGVQFHLGGAVGALAILGLIALAYWLVGILLAALVLIFRTTGPLPTAIFALTALFGGVYYPTRVIPGWLQSFGAIVPSTYGLRAVRRLVMPHAGAPALLPDVAVLSAMVLMLAAVAGATFVAALRYARARGTLAQY